MVVDLRQVFVGSLLSYPISYLFDMSGVEFAGVFPLGEPVRLNGAVSNKADLVELKAELSFVWNAPCDRCGALTERRHTVRLDKVIVVSVEGEESDDLLLAPDMKLDLDELIFSEVVVHAPTKHLCRADCRGICAVCGRNLNEGDCGCRRDTADPRLAPLKELLK